MSIPADVLVTINPSVIAAAGTGVVMNSVMLTQNTAIPNGSIVGYSSLAAVGAALGATSTEYKLAAVYFGGYDNKTQTPGMLYFWRFNTTAVAGYMRSASLASMTLAQLQALTGTLTLTVDGTAKTSTNIVFSGATSFSAAAALIQAALTGVTVTYSATQSAFIITSATTGASSSVSYASGALATSLLMTQATGAVLSTGAAASVEATSMNALKAASLNWVTFFTAWEPLIASKLAFSAWVNTQNQRFAYIGCDSDASPTASATATTSWGAQLAAANTSGTVPIYQPSTATLFGDKAAFVAGAIASVDFSRLNGRTTMAFRSQSGLTADVTDATIYANLKANGYNCYAIFGANTEDFTWLQPGSISGEYDWIDTYINQVWLNANLQIYLLTLMQNAGSIPYNPAGYAMIEAAMGTPITNALNFGAIRAGVTIDDEQAAELQAAAGLAIASYITAKGYYLQVLDPGSTVRAARGTPVINLWYADGGSIQQITVASVVIQ